MSKTRKGLRLAKTLLGKFLTYRATGFLRKPQLAIQLFQRASNKMDEYDSPTAFANDVWGRAQGIVRMVTAAVRGDYKGLSRRKTLLTAGAIIYFVSPLDIIPDALPFVGVLDDIWLIGWIVKTLDEEYDKFQEWEKTNAVTGDATQKLIEAPETSLN